MLLHTFAELFLLITFLPAWIAFRKGDIGQDELMSNDDIQKEIFAGREFLDELEKQLPKYLHLGYFEDD